MEQVSDAALMAGVRQGDRRAFAQLVDRYKDDLVGYLSALSGSRERGEDLAQDTFLRLYERADRYQEQGKLSGYLYRMGGNLARSALRKEQRRRWLRAAFLLPDPEAANSPTPQSALLLSERQRLVKDALDQLPLNFREPLLLHAVEGLAYQDVATALGCQEGTVKSRISRARARLRQSLTRVLEEESDDGSPARSSAEGAAARKSVG